MGPLLALYGMSREDASPVAATVAAAQAGDLGAWQDLAREFQDVAVGLAFGLVGNVEGARDVAQEALLLSFQHLGELEAPAAFPAWAGSAGTDGQRPAIIGGHDRRLARWR